MNTTQIHDCLEKITDKEIKKMHESADLNMDLGTVLDKIKPNHEVWKFDEMGHTKVAGGNGKLIYNILDLPFPKDELFFLSTEMSMVRQNRVVRLKAAKKDDL